MASSTPDNFFKAVLGALAIAGTAVTIGMGHSLVEPVQLRLDPSALAPAEGSPRPAATPGTDAPESVQPAAGEAVGGEGVEPEAAAADPEVSPPAADGYRLSLGQAREAFIEGAIFLDARPRREFDISRIEGAMHLSTQAINTTEGGEVLDTLLGLGTDIPIVLYCHGGDCDASENTAIRLQQMGFTDIRIMTAGFDEWEAAGYEVEIP